MDGNAFAPELGGGKTDRRRDIRPLAPAVVLRHGELGHGIGVAVSPRDRGEDDRDARYSEDDRGEQRDDPPALEHLAGNEITKRGRERVDGDDRRQHPGAKVWRGACRKHRERRAVDGARRCFAEHGYEGATVTKLEREIGLSRGAIFNYFSSKDDLFLELARRDNERLIQLWTEKGWEATLREVVEEDPDWSGVYLELSRKERTNPELSRLHRAQAEKLAPALIEHVRDEQARGELREDVSAEKIVGFVSIVANGIAVQLGSGEPIRDVDTLLALVRSAVGPPKSL